MPRKAKKIPEDYMWSYLIDVWQNTTELERQQVAADWCTNNRKEWPQLEARGRGLVRIALVIAGLLQIEHPLVCIQVAMGYELRYGNMMETAIEVMKADMRGQSFPHPCVQGALCTQPISDFANLEGVSTGE